MSQRYLPMEPVSEVVRELLNDEGSEWGSMTELANETGVNPRQLHTIVHQTYKSCSYDLVDKLLTRTHNFMLWYEEPLAPYADESQLPAHGVITGVPKKPKVLCKGCRAELKNSKKTGYCLSCWRKKQRNGIDKKHDLCSCGGMKRKDSIMCRACYKRDRKKFMIRGANGQFLKT